MIKKFFIEILVKFLLEGLQALFNAYAGPLIDQKKTKENKEQLENAESDDEFQDAANDLAGHLGRNP